MRWGAGDADPLYPMLGKRSERIYVHSLNHRADYVTAHKSHSSILIDGFSPGYSKCTS